jgi:hypothetical protein
VGNGLSGPHLDCSDLKNLKAIRPCSVVGNKNHSNRSQFFIPVLNQQRVLA